MGADKLESQISDSLRWTIMDLVRSANGGAFVKQTERKEKSNRKKARRCREESGGRRSKCSGN
ncbi:Protein CBG26329 [Caenorhabditis briggsae]|uniref:Protein CBG26329 n=1 Tax=Caenorhabditis briggsae TaxID=6238 RepID=B6IGA1_CAEBR|nr:Protein CBG26329 [Caenorhabditis briggsae]CAR98931.1 Protein CBG26329 [Caenorhabditis briggsae]